VDGIPEQNRPRDGLQYCWLNQIEAGRSSDGSTEVTFYSSLEEALRGHKGAPFSVLSDNNKCDCLFKLAGELKVAIEKLEAFNRAQ